MLSVQVWEQRCPDVTTTNVTNTASPPLYLEQQQKYVSATLPLFLQCKNMYH